MAGRRDHPDEGRRPRLADGRGDRQPGDRRPQAARARGLPLRSRRRLARTADAARRPAGSTTSSGSRSMRVITDELSSSPFTTEATVKVWVGDSRYVCTSEGNGPVNAIDTALRAAIQQAYPHIANIHLTDYKVRILDGGQATGAVTRVLLVGDRWRAGLDDDRRQPEHHRSVLAGARGERRLRPPPCSGLIAYDHALHVSPQVSPRRTARDAVLLVARRRARLLDARSSGSGRRTAAVRPSPRHAGPRPGVRARHRQAAWRPSSICNRARRRTTRSRVASASRSSGRRCTGGRPVVHDLRSRSRSGASSIPIRRTICSPCAAGCSRASATRSTTTPRPAASPTWCPSRRCG